MLLGLVVGNFAGPAYAISRVGSREIGDLREGFVARVPMLFELIESLTEERIQLRSPTAVVGTADGWTEVRLQVSPLARDFSELTTLDRARLAAWAAARAWGPLDVTTDPCVAAYGRNSDTASFAVAAWGEGRGIVLIGPRGAIVNEKIRELLASLTLDPGACRW
jgi:hypothetical protein